MAWKVLYKNKRVSLQREITCHGKHLSKAEEDLHTFGDKTLNVHGSVTVAIINNFLWLYGENLDNKS